LLATHDSILFIDDSKGYSSQVFTGTKEQYIIATAVDELVFGLPHLGCLMKEGLVG
jgi:hypothetical protein